MKGDRLWFSCIEHADRFANALTAAGHTCERIFDDDFSWETAWRHGVDYDAPEVSEHSTTSYSPAGRMASRFQEH